MKHFLLWPFLWPYYLGRGAWIVLAEVYDIVEFHGSRWRARRRLPGARALPVERD